MIRGLRNGLGWLSPLAQLVSSTDGCIAPSDADVDMVWESLGPGTPIRIKPEPGLNTAGYSFGYCLWSQARFFDDRMTELTGVNSWGEHT